MENNKKDNKFTLILLLIIIVLFSILFYYCLEVLEVIDTENSLSVASLMNETIKTVSNTKNQIKERVGNFEIEENLDENSNSSKEMQDMILKELETQDSEVNIEENTYKKEIDHKRFYYNEINDDAKIIYDKLYENKENLKTGTYKIELGNSFDDILKEKDGTIILKDAYTQAVRALLFDNPDIYFLDVSKLCIVTETKTSVFSKEYNVNIMPEEGEKYLSSHFNTEGIIKSSSNEMQAVVDKIKLETENLSNIDKIKYVHDYLVESIEYDDTISKPNIHNIYGALISKNAVCEGYSKAFKYILDELDIPSIIVVGYAFTEGNYESHSWNYVNIDGKWYGMDVTFDDPIVLGGPVLSSNIRYKYYLKGSKEFSDVHNIDSKSILEFNINYPELEEENY